MCKLTGLVIALALTGCATAPCVPAPPKTVQVPVPVRVAIPGALLAPCPVEMPADATVGEVVRVARERRAALEQCNRQIEAIKKGQ